MAQKNSIRQAFYALTVAATVWAAQEARADDSVETREQLRELQQQNQALQLQLQQPLLMLQHSNTATQELLLRQPVQHMQQQP